MSVEKQLRNKMLQEDVNIPSELVFNIPASNRIIKDKRSVKLIPSDAKTTMTGIASSGQTITFRLGSSNSYLDINSLRLNTKFKNASTTAAGVALNYATVSWVKPPGLYTLIKHIVVENDAGNKIDDLQDYNVFASLMAQATMEKNYFGDWGQLEGVSNTDATLQAFHDKNHSLHLFYGLLSSNSNKKVLPMMYDTLKLTFHLEDPARCLHTNSGNADIMKYTLEDINLTFDLLDVDDDYQRALNNYMMQNSQVGIPIHYESYFSQKTPLSATGSQVFYVNRPIKSAKTIFVVATLSGADKADKFTFIRYPRVLKDYQFNVGNRSRPEYQVNNKQLKFLEFKKALHMSSDVHTQGILQYSQYDLSETVGNSSTTISQTAYGLDLERTTEDRVNGHVILGNTDVSLSATVNEVADVLVANNAITLANYSIHMFIMHDTIMGLRPKEAGSSYVVR